MKFFERHDKIVDGKFVLLTLIDIAKRRDCPPDKLLRGTALFYPDCLQPDALITQKQLVQLISNAKRTFKQDDLSFQIGRRLFPTHLGHIGHALMHCRTVAIWRT